MSSQVGMPVSAWVMASKSVAVPCSEVVCMVWIVLVDMRPIVKGRLRLSNYTFRLKPLLLDDFVLCKL